MKVLKKLFALILTFVLLIGCIPLPTVYAKAPKPVKNVTEDYENAIYNAVNWAKQGNTYLFNDLYLQSAGSTAGDWMPIALGRYGKIRDKDSEYIKALKKHVVTAYEKNNGKLHRVKATEWHRISLAATAMGADPTNFGTYNGKPINLIEDGVYNAKTGVPWKQGINGAFFALISLDSKGYEVPSTAKYNRHDLIEKIVSSQCKDGGFSLDLRKSDPDMTGMALQALAPYKDDTTVYSTGKTVGQVIDEALAWASTAQHNDGDFSSWGVPSCESAVQMLVALCSLGIDPLKDNRFIKNGNTLLDAIEKYRQADGGFAHSYQEDKDNPDSIAGQSNGMATDQAAYGLVSYYRFRNDMRNLYDMRPEANKKEIIFTDGVETVSTPFDKNKNEFELSISESAKNIIFKNLPIGVYDKAKVDNIENYKVGNKVSIENKESIIVEVTKRDSTKYSFTLNLIRLEESEVDFITKSIANLPKKLSLDNDKETVDELYSRYEALKEEDKLLVSNRDTLLKAKEELDTKLAKEFLIAEQLVKDIDNLPQKITLKDKKTVKNLVETFGTLSKYAKDKVTNSAKLKKAWNTIVKLEDGDKHNKIEKATGSTKHVKVPVKKIKYKKDEHILGLIQDITSLHERLKSGEGAESLYPEAKRLYQEYAKLAYEQTLFIDNANLLEKVLTEVGKDLHTDKATGIIIEPLPWYVKVQVTVFDNKDNRWKSIEEKSANVTLTNGYEIKLINTLDNKNFTPDETLKVTMADPGKDGFKGLIAIGFNEKDGKISYYEIFHDNKNISFESNKLSIFAIAGYEGQSPLELAGLAPEKTIPGKGIYIALGALFVGLLILIAVLIKINHKKK